MPRIKGGQRAELRISLEKKTKVNSLEGFLSKYEAKSGSETGFVATNRILDLVHYFILYCLQMATVCFDYKEYRYNIFYK